MQLASAFSNHTDIISAVSSLSAQLAGKVEPSFMVCYYTENYDATSLADELKNAFPGIPFHGCSSCQGVMTDKGYHIAPAVALLAIDDLESSAYGAYYQTFSNNSPTAESVTQCTVKAVEGAIDSANRKGELPSLLLLHASIGNEELIIDAIKNKFGFHIPLIGGSAADNGNFQHSSFLTDKGAASEGVSVSVFYPSTSISTYFSTGYLPTEIYGVATKVKGRTLYTIDNQPALEVYKEWIYEHSGKREVGHYLFNQTMAYPLGRIVGTLYEKPFYKLSHLLRSTEDGGVEVFSNIKEGERLYLMQGSSELLVSRASRVVEAAKNENIFSFPLNGGINIFCAGSMVLVKDRMDEVCDLLRYSYRESPFICPFTFGEQGRFLNEENVHGNLMASTALFYANTIENR
ncbi:FIST signal transduction protein [Vibrio albus]|nr:FIST N-terminal domain-containing protein [Vibrio albus]